MTEATVAPRNAHDDTKYVRGIPASSLGPAMSSVRNMIAMPVAARLWISRFTSTGTMPTNASMIPITTNRLDTMRDERGFASLPFFSSASMSVAIYTANEVTSRPPAMSVPLKTQLERSSKVPSWLKWTDHHSLSGVVTMDVSVPSTTNVISSVDIRCVVIRDTERKTRYAVIPSVTAMSTTAQKVMTGSPTNPRLSTRYVAYVARNARAACAITTETVLTVYFQAGSERRHSSPGRRRARQYPMPAADRRDDPRADRRHDAERPRPLEDGRAGREQGDDEAVDRAQSAGDEGDVDGGGLDAERVRRAHLAGQRGHALVCGICAHGVSVGGRPPRATHPVRMTSAATGAAGG